MVGDAYSMGIETKKKEIKKIKLKKIIYWNRYGNGWKPHIIYFELTIY